MGKDDIWSLTMLGANGISPSSLATACSASLDDLLQRPDAR